MSYEQKSGQLTIKDHIVISTAKIACIAAGGFGLVTMYDSNRQVVSLEEQLVPEKTKNRIALVQSARRTLQEASSNLEHEPEYRGITGPTSPEDCPDLDQAKLQMDQAEREAGFVAGLSDELEDVKKTLPPGNNVCVVDFDPVDSDTFAQQRAVLDDIVRRMLKTEITIYESEVPETSRRRIEDTKMKLYLQGVPTLLSWVSLLLAWKPLPEYIAERKQKKGIKPARNEK